MASDSISPRDFSALEKRVTSLETRLDRLRDDMSRSLGDVKGVDDRMDQKVGELEKRLRRDIKGLATEKDIRVAIDVNVLTKLDNLEKLSESRVKTLNTAMERAKAYDDKLEGMISDLRTKIDRLARGS